MADNLSAIPDEPETETVRWMREQLKLSFVDVWFFGPQGIHEERHVDDGSTIRSTVAMSLERGLGRAAVYRIAGDWVVHRIGQIKYFDTREAAEMFALHVSG